MTTAIAHAHHHPAHSSSHSLMQHAHDIQMQHAAVMAAARANGWKDTQSQQADAAAAAPTACGLQQPNLRRGATAPAPRPPAHPATAATIAARKAAAAPLRATVLANEPVSAAAAAALGLQSPQPPLQVPVAAHVLADVGDSELGKKLQSRLGTLGIGANLVKVEVRPNSDAPNGGAAGAAPAAAASSAAAAASPAASRCFTLTLTGRLQLGLASLFNILIAHFLEQHAQITRVERNIGFISAPPSSKAEGSRRSTISDEDADETCVDSPPILQLKVKHLAKLLAASKATVVYTGDYLCQSSALSSAAASSGDAVVAPALAASAEDASCLSELSAPHPPTLLVEWVRNGAVQHIVNENTDGLFNPPPHVRRNRASSMSDSDENSDDDSSVTEQLPLGAELLSEPFGNKFKEVCSAGCSLSDESFLRDFEVQSMRLPAPLRARSAGATLMPPPQPQDAHLTGRSCSYCSAPLRDTLVGWNESLPREVLQRCVSLASQADLSLVLGSRLRRSPFADLPALARGAPVVIVQASSTAKDEACVAAGGILIRAPPALVLAKLELELRRLKKGTATPVVPSKGQKATPAIVRKSSPDASPILGAAVAPALAASSHPVRAIALRSGAAQLASSLQLRDMKKQRVGSSSAHFSQRRGSNLSLAASGLNKPDMLRASTAAPSLLSMDPARRAAPMRLSAALPPFPCLDDCDEEDDDDAVPPPSAPCRAYSEQPAPLQYRAMRSLSRLSSVSSSAARGSMDSAAASGSSASNSTSLLLMLQGLPSLPSTPSPDHADTLGSPNFYRSLSPPPELFTPCTPMTSGQDEQTSEMQH